MANNSSNGNSFDLKPRYTDEIDLMEVFFKSIVLLRKYKTLIFLSLMFALAAGIVLKIFVNPRYTSTIVINTPNLENEEITQIVNSIDLQLEDPSFVLHGILEELAIQPTSKEKDSNSDDKSYVIAATVTEADQLTKVREFIVSSIEGNSYVTHLKQVETERLQQTLKGIEEEEKRVSDVLNHTIASNLPNENFSVADLAKLKIDLMKEKATIKAALENVRGVSIVKDFENVPHPDNKKLIVLFGVPLLVCILLLTGYIMIKELSTQFRMYEADVVRSERITIQPTKPIIKRTSYRPRVRQP